jgi:hypothetical protein
VHRDAGCGDRDQDGRVEDEPEQRAAPPAAPGRAQDPVTTGQNLAGTMFVLDRGEILSHQMTAVILSPVAFSGAQWTLLIVFVIPVVILWGYAIVSLIGRHDLGVGGKLMWLIGILVVPIIGAVLYVMLRPAPQEENRRAQARHRKR